MVFHAEMTAGLPGSSSGCGDLLGITVIQTSLRLNRSNDLES
jgi:hypothetical protein